MDKTETGFFKMQEFKGFLWLKYIDGIFFIWTHGEPELKKFINLINFCRTLNLCTSH